MAQYVPDILLWLFVINHGVAFGAGLLRTEDRSSAVVQPLHGVRYSREQRGDAQY
jgi:lipoprotein signal peptidase